jgi:predicted transcriptional regulator
MSQVLSLRLPDHMAERLDHFAQQQGNGMNRDRASLLLLEEALRQSEFTYIEFRDSAIGRQAYMKGSRLTVWWVIRIAKDFDMDADAVARHLQQPVEWVKAALRYYEVYPQEIGQAIEAGYVSFEELKRRLPQATLFEAPHDGATETAA